MRRLLACLALLVAVAPAAAQLDVLAKTTPAQRAAAQTAYLKTALVLTPDQTTQVAALNLRYAEKAEPVLKGSEWAMKKASEIRALQDAKDGELKALLTSDQWSTYESGKDAMKTAVEAQLAKEVGQ
ncbi:MAG: hypothetical protein KIT14_16215 [bacterium]|nr:hypothetical protein [bacterium]